MATSAIWHTRYWLGRWLITLGLWILPRGRYHDELTKAIYDLRDRVMLEVAVRRAYKQTIQRNDPRA